MACNDSINNIVQDKDVMKCNYSNSTVECMDDYIDDYLEVDAEDNIIKDIGLRTAMNKQLGKSLLSSVTIDDLNSLTGILDARDYRIKNLEGIEYAKNVSCLLLQHNSLTDISPLTTLSNLEYLSLNYNHIHQFPCMRKMFNLKKIYFSYNHIMDINPLIDLPNLTSIYGLNQRIKLKPVTIDADNHAEVSINCLFDQNSNLKLNECSINPQGLYYPECKTLLFTDVKQYDYACFSFEKIYHNKYTSKPLVFGGIVDVSLIQEE